MIGPCIAQHNYEVGREFRNKFISKNKNNLISPILIHGFYDTIGVTLLYLNQDRIVSDWIQQLF